MVENAINYEYWLLSDGWYIEDAIMLIKGITPPFAHEWETPEYSKLLQHHSYIEIQETITYREIKSAIKAKTIKYKNNLLDIREFYKWANSNNKILDSNWHKYFNYEYWIEKESWTFSEAITLACSDNCPFPSDIISDVFEDDRTADLAHKFFSLYNYAKHINNILKLSFSAEIFLGNCKKIKQKYPKQLNLVFKQKKKNDEIENKIKNFPLFEKQKCSEEDFKEWLQYPYTTEKELISYLMGVNINLMLFELADLYSEEEILLLLSGNDVFEKKISENDLYFKIKKHLKGARDSKSIYFKKIENNEKRSLSFKKKTKLEVSVLEEVDFKYKPLEVYQYLSTRIKIPELMVSAFNNLGKVQVISNSENKTLEIKEENYSSPFMELMIKCIKELKITSDNQPKKETLVDWFMRELKSIEAPSKNKAEMMATLVRLPEAQKGGFLKPKNQKD
jgi:hypothetical protein